jgi:hypothetical protein
MAMEPLLNLLVEKATKIMLKSVMLTEGVKHIW